MRWLLAVLVVLVAAALGASSCKSTSAACVEYCSAVAEALDRCDLASDGDFDEADCAERTADVEDELCSSTVDDLDDADCADIQQSFCPDSSLDCPDECFSECCSNDDCPVGLGRCNSGRCVQCTEETAATDCPETKSCYLEQCVECTEATAAVACQAGEACTYQNECRKTCLDATQCPMFTDCVVDFCSEPIGTPCPEGDECGGANCETLDARGAPVPGYCTLFCSDSLVCPPGYTCVDYYCRP